MKDDKQDTKLLIVALIDVSIPIEDTNDVAFLMDDILTRKVDELRLVSDWLATEEGDVGAVKQVYFKKLVKNFDEFMVLNEITRRDDGVIVSSILHLVKTEKEE